MNLLRTCVTALVLSLAPVILSAQRATHPDFGPVHGVIAIRLQSFQRGDTIWRGGIQDYRFASVVDLEAILKDSTGEWRRVVPRVEMIVRHDSLSTVVPHCEIDSLGAADTVIGLAAYPVDSDVMMGRVAKAWVVSISSRRFVPFPATRVRCENPYLD